MKKKNNRWLIILLVIVALGVIGAIVAKKSGIIKEDAGLEVTTNKAKRTDIIEKVSCSGKIQPESEVRISSDVSGEIVTLTVKEGDSVKAGQLLVQIRPDNYKSMVDRARAGLEGNRAQLEQSQANLSAAKARLVRADLDFTRNERLFKDKAVSSAEYEQSKANLEVAKQDVAAAQATLTSAKFNIQSSEANLRDAIENLRKTSIYAPVSGTVSLLNVKLGERVVGTSQMTGTEMLRLANLRAMEVLVDVNENDIIRLELGDSADVDVDSYSLKGKKFKGIVTAMANAPKGSKNANSSATNTDQVTEYEVKVRLLPSSYLDISKKGQSSPFRPGMTASVDIITEKAAGVLTVPLSAVTMRPESSIAVAAATDDEAMGGTPDAPKPKKDNAPKAKQKEFESVFIIEKGKAKMVKVKTGISDFENISITEGLKEGQEVISGPFIAVSKKLKNGLQVKSKGSEDAADKKGGVSVSVGTN